MDIFIVKVNKKADRALEKLPLYLVDKLHLWIDMVENEGLRESRKIKAFHDEPLKGNRKGQRSIRLNKAYRAIYVERTNHCIEFVEVMEVNKHDY